MKAIVEEWKTIEEFPSCEISNMGRCRNKKCGLLKSVITSHRKGKKHPSYEYSFYKDHHRVVFSAGKLVAKYFVPNPNGYIHVRYKDGNPGNFCYLNIEWARLVCDGLGGNKRTIRGPEELILELQEIKTCMEKQIKYLKEGKITELVNDEFLPVIKKSATYLPLRPKAKLRYDEKDDFISFAIELVHDRITRGIFIAYNYSKYIDKCVLAWYIKSKNDVVKKTVSFDESYAKHNTSDDYDMNYYY